MDNIKVEDGIKLRGSEEPKKKGYGYKVFFKDYESGKLYPPMVKNKNGAATPMGVWIDAVANEISSYTKTGRPQVEKGGTGTHTTKGNLAYRPGWHLGEVPVAVQFNKLNPENGKLELFPREFVWCLCEYSQNQDYQQEADNNGMTDKGAFRHAYAGLQKVPEDGYYRYRTNPNPDTERWIICGSMKIIKELSREEVIDVCKRNGREPQKFESSYEELEKNLLAEFNEKFSESAKSTEMLNQKKLNELYLTSLSSALEAFSKNEKKAIVAILKKKNIANNKDMIDYLASNLSEKSQSFILIKNEKSENISR